MSDPVADLPTMPEARLREWFAQLPHEELVEMFVSYVRVYMRDREGLDSEHGALGDLSTLTFAQLIDRLKLSLQHPELSRLRVDGERVVFVTDSGREVIVNATGEQQMAPPGSPLGARTAPTAPPAERPPDAHVSGDRAAPPQRSRGGGMFGGAAAPERRVGGPGGVRAGGGAGSTTRTGGSESSGSGDADKGKKKRSLLEF